MFPNEHPGYVKRRLEAQNQKLRQISADLGETDSSDGEAMHKVLSSIAESLAEIAMATGTLAQWMERQR